MAGNSQRRGARRTEGSKKGASAGSGGQRGKALAGQGPDPSGGGAHRSPGCASGASPRPDATATRRTRTRSPGRRHSGKSTVTRSRSSPVATACSRRCAPASPCRRCTSPSGSTPTTGCARSCGSLASRQAPAARGPAGRARPASREARSTRGWRCRCRRTTTRTPTTCSPGPTRRPGSVPLLAALDGVTDPRNLGAVIRSVAAFGGHGVLVPERRSAGVTAGAWKASAGAAARIPVARATNLTRALQAYRKAGCVVVGLAADGATDLADLEVAEDPLVLVVGSEGKGLSRLVTETCDLLVRIPMHSETESLNAGVAAPRSPCTPSLPRAAAPRLERSVEDGRQMLMVVSLGVPIRLPRTALLVRLVGRARRRRRPGGRRASRRRDRRARTGTSGARAPRGRSRPARACRAARAAPDRTTGSKTSVTQRCAAISSSAPRSPCSRGRRRGR